MDAVTEALNEWIDRVLEARQISDEMLNIPGSAIEKSAINVSYTEADISQLIKQFQQLKSVESKRDEAYMKYINNLKARK